MSTVANEGVILNLTMKSVYAAVALLALVYFVAASATDASSFENILKLRSHRAHKRGNLPLAVDAKLGSLFEIESYAKGTPVHEMITIQALIDSQYIDGTTCKDIMKCRTTFHGVSSAQFVRGVQFNDDPKGLLWKDGCDDLELELGLRFATEFCGCECRAGPYHRQDWMETRRRNGWHSEFYTYPDNLLCRSHFGDLSFLHGQEPTVGVDPSYTKSKIMLWIKFTYLVATGKIKHSASMRALNSGDKALDEFFKRIFPDIKLYRLFDISCPTDVNKFGANTMARALGSLLHTIQDSYAVGHANRKQSLDSLGNGGEILQFTAYPAQDHSHHAFYDQFPTGFKPKGKDPSLYSQAFSYIPGASAALRACIKVVTLVKQNAPWTEVALMLEEHIFKLSVQPPALRSGAGKGSSGTSLSKSVSDSAQHDMCNAVISTISVGMDLKQICVSVPAEVDRIYRGTGSHPPRNLYEDKDLCVALLGSAQCSRAAEQASIHVAIPKTYVKLVAVKVINQEDWTGRDQVKVFAYVNGVFVGSYAEDIGAGERKLVADFKYSFTDTVKFVVREIDNDYWDQIGQVLFEPVTKFEEKKQTINYAAKTGDASYTLEFRLCPEEEKAKCGF